MTVRVVVLFQKLFADYRQKLNCPFLFNDLNSGVPVEDWKIVPTYADGTNFNGLLVYGIVMGLAAVKLGVYGKPLIAFTRCLSECVAFLSNHMMWSDIRIIHSYLM